MRYQRHVPEGLLRDLVKAVRSNVFAGDIIDKIEAELKAIDAEVAQERAHEEARKKPPLTTQKVVAVLRKAKLQIASVPSGLAGVGGATGFDVSYGDWELRTWVRVQYSFVAQWAYHHGISDGRLAMAAKSKERTKQLAAAESALVAAGLQVVALEDTANYRALKVTA